MTDEDEPLRAGGIFGDGNVAFPEEQFELLQQGAEDRLQAIATSLREGRASPEETVRTLLSWFGAERRGYRVVAMIRRALEQADLLTDPDFESVYIDAPVAFRLRPRIVAARGQVAVPSFRVEGVGSVTTSAEKDESAEAPRQVADASHRLSRLAAASNKPLAVAPDAPLSQAVTQMILNDFSQLPVMSGERNPRGAITWMSIASRLSMGSGGAVVQDFMDPVVVLDSDASLFDAIRTIADKQFVLVRVSDGRISGIVTASDLSVQFHSLAEPFLLLSEIENAVRRLLQSRFSNDELAAAKNPADEFRRIRDVNDMTFGEYVRLLENPENWKRLPSHLDRSVVILNLKRIKDIRNKLMHFDPDGIRHADLETLQTFSRFMRRMGELGVAEPA
jgi:CBS domain-containing protein